MRIQNSSRFLLFVVVFAACNCLGIVECLPNPLELGVSVDLNGQCISAKRDRMSLQSQNVLSTGAILRQLRLKGGSSFAKAPLEDAQLHPKRIHVAKESVVWLSKGILAAFTGLLTTSSVLVAFEYTAHKICADEVMESGRVAQSLAAMVTSVLVGALVGSGLGGWVIARLAPSHPGMLAGFVGLLFTVAQYLNLQAVDHPAQFVAAATALSPLKSAKPSAAVAASTADAAPAMTTSETGGDVSESEVPSYQRASEPAPATPAADGPRRPSRKATAVRTPAKTPRKKTVKAE